MADPNFDTYKQRPTSKREDDIVADSLREFSQLQSWRNVFAAQWEEVAELILPATSNTFMYGNFNWPGQKKTARQIDSTGMVALSRFAAILDSLLTPKNMKWHGLSADDDYVMKDRATKLWFEQVTNILFKYRYNALANFSSQNSNNWLQLGAFGTHGMFIDEFDNTLYPQQRGMRYKSIPMGELFLRRNHQGLVDGFIRWFRLSARQAWQKWGDSGTFPDTLRPALQNDSELLYNFIHRVVPRNDYDPERLDERGKPYASFYISMEGRCLLSEGGYRMMPAAISTYRQFPGEVYGRSPAMDVLPSLKTLNAQKTTFLKQGHRAADPVLLTADDGIVDMSLRPGAINKGGMTADGKPLVGVLPTGNIQINENMMALEKGLIDDVFLVNLFQMALQLKDLPQMTATQVVEITNQKGILIAPTVGGQFDYLSFMAERELDVLGSQGLLPPMPPRLKEAGGFYKVIITNPMAKAMRAQDASGFMRSVEISKEIVSITQDPSYLDWADFDTAMPEIAEINGSPVSWTSSPDQITAKRKARAEAMARQQQIQEAPAKAAMIKATAMAAKSGALPPGQQPAEGGPPLAQQVG